MYINKKTLAFGTALTLAVSGLAGDALRALGLTDDAINLSNGYAVADTNGEAAGLRTEEGNDNSDSKKEKKPSLKNSSTSESTQTPSPTPTLSPEDLKVDYIGGMPAFFPFLGPEYFDELSNGILPEELRQDPYIHVIDAEKGIFKDEYACVSFDKGPIYEPGNGRKFTRGYIAFSNANFVVEVIKDVDTKEVFFQAYIAGEMSWADVPEICGMMYNYVRENQKEPLMEHLDTAVREYLTENGIDPDSKTKENESDVKSDTTSASSLTIPQQKAIGKAWAPITRRTAPGKNIV